MNSNKNHALIAVHTILKQKKKEITNSNIQKTIYKTLLDFLNNNNESDALLFLELITEPLENNIRGDFLKLAVSYIQKNKLKSNWVDFLSKNFTKTTLDEFLFINKANIKDLQFIIRINFEDHYKKVPLEHRNLLLGFICDNITFIEGFNLNNILEFLYEEVKFKGEHVSQQFGKFIWLYCNNILKKKYNKESFAQIAPIIEDDKSSEKTNMYLLKVVAEILKINHYNAARNEEIIFNFSENTLNKINGICETSNEYLEIFKNIILYAYKDYEKVIADFIVLQMHAYKNTKSYFSLEIILCFSSNFGLERNFIKLIYDRDFEIDDFLEVYKRSVNEEISLFISFIADFKNTDDAFSVFSTFTNFATNKNREFSAVASILIEELDKKNSKTAKYIALGITNLITSYVRYTKHNILLQNPITNEEIEDVFNIIIEKDFFSLFYSAYISTMDIIFLEAVQSILLIKIIDNSIIDSIQKVLMTIKEGEVVDLTQINYVDTCKDVISLLKVAKLFVYQFQASSTFTAKILSFLITKNNVLQKNAYGFLYEMIKYDKLGICICDTLVAVDYLNYYTCSIRNRLNTLFALYNHCKKCNKTNNTFLSKIIYELILNTRCNSAKARKISEDILDSNLNDFNYKEFLKSIVLGLNSDKYEIINGAIHCLIYFIKNKKDYIDKNLNTIINHVQKLTNKGKQVQVSVIELYKTMIMEIEGIDAEEYMGYISKFANKRQKVDNAIKRAGKDLKGKARLTKEMDNIVHKKHKRHDNIDFKITKKGVVEMGYKTVFESDSE